MTKTFKLIRTYPNSPAIGTEVVKTDESYYLTNEGLSFTVNEIENFPFFWEQVVPFSFITVDGVEITDPTQRVYYFDETFQHPTARAASAYGLLAFSNEKAYRLDKDNFSLNDVKSILSGISFLDKEQREIIYQAFYDYQYND